MTTRLRMPMPKRRRAPKRNPARSFMWTLVLSRATRFTSGASGRVSPGRRISATCPLPSSCGCPFPISPSPALAPMRPTRPAKNTGRRFAPDRVRVPSSAQVCARRRADRAPRAGATVRGAESKPVRAERVLRDFPLNVSGVNSGGRALGLKRRTGYAQVDGLSIAFQTYGDGPFHLIVAPGYMTNIDQNWEWPGYAHFLERLGSFAQVVLIDRRGTGLSDRVPSHSAFENTLDDVRAVMDEVGVERAALLGGGEGGPTCVLFAATFPSRTTALVLIAPHVARAFGAEVPWGITPEVREQGLRTIDEKWGRAPIGSRLYAPSIANDPAFIDWYQRAQRAGGTPSAARAWVEMTLDIDVRRILPAIGVPTRVLRRAGDPALAIQNNPLTA